jgi:hypothetical protein
MYDVEFFDSRVTQEVFGGSFCRQANGGTRDKEIA